jgi:hypothetical protein
VHPQQPAAHAGLDIMDCVAGCGLLRRRSCPPLKQSLATEATAPKSRKRKSASGQKEKLMSIEGKNPAAKKAAKHERSTAESR